MVMLKENSKEDRVPNLKFVECVKLLDDKKSHWNDILEDNIKGEVYVHTLMWIVEKNIKGAFD